MFWKRKTEPQIAETQVAADVEPDADEADGLFKRAKELAEALWAFQLAAQEAEAKPEDEELVTAQKKVAAARQMVLEGPLGNALVLQLLDHTEYWPSWKSREDFSDWVHFDADDIEAEKKDISTDHKRMHEVRNAFSFQGKRYACVLRDQGYSSAPGEATKFGEGEFWDGENLVLKVGLIDEISEYSRFRPFDVRAFKPGPWMQDLLSIAAQIETRDDEAVKRYSDDDVREAARNIDL